MSATSSTEAAAVDVDVEDWISGVSFLQSKTTIYRDPAIFAEYEPLLAKIAELEVELEDLVDEDQAGAEQDEEERPLSGEEPMTRRAADVGEQALGEKAQENPRIAELRLELDGMYTKAEELYAAYQKDVEVWTLRKLEQTEIDAIREELGEGPKEPVHPGKNAKAQARTLYVRKVDAYMQAMKPYTREFNLRVIAAATLNVQVCGEDQGEVTLEQMRRVEARPGGGSQVLELYRGLERIQGEGVEIVAPHRSRA